MDDMQQQPLSRPDRETESPSRSGGRDRARAKVLSRAFETEVLPRLLLARGSADAAATQAVPTPAQKVLINGDAVTELTGLVLARDADGAAAFVRQLHERGIPIETLYLDLLTPTARHLGELWCEDLCDIADVTLGTWRLRQMLRTFEPGFMHEEQTRNNGRQVLLLPVPGERHSFGLNMVADFFRRAGWSVADDMPDTVGKILALIQDTAFSVVGFSIACEEHLDLLHGLIRRIRSTSCNARIGVLVGGPLLVEQPALAMALGADATALDARHAVLQANTICGLSTQSGEAVD